MGLLTKFKDIVLRCDLFAANPTLRVRGEPAYENAICGVISLVLIGAFIGIFAGQVLSVLQKTHISASTNTAVPYFSIFRTILRSQIPFLISGSPLGLKM